MKRGLLAVLLAMLLVLVMGGIAWAATFTLSLAGNDTATASCAGKSLSVQRNTAKKVTLTCRPSASASASSTSPSITPSTTSTGGTCTSPVFTTSDSQGVWQENGGDVYWVNNDAWNGSHGPQTINVCSRSSWTAVSNQTNNQGQVETYPDTEFFPNGWNKEYLGQWLPISSFHSITSTYSEQFPTDGSMDAAYDLWLNNWGTEVMVWNEDSGTQTYWNTQGTAVTVAGVSYRFIDNGGEFVFIRTQQNKSGSLDILAILDYLVAQGDAKASDGVTQLEYGVEVCSTVGTESFPLTGLTFAVS